MTGRKSSTLRNIAVWPDACLRVSSAAMLRRVPASLRIAAVAALLAVPAAAHAEGEITFEPRASLLVPGNMIPHLPDKVYGGAGIAVNAGLSLDLEPIIVEPELSLVGDGFPTLHGGTFRAMAGIRAGIAAAVEPSIFLHAGYGFIGDNALGGSAGPAFNHGFSLDTGATVDYRLSRKLTLGGSLGYELLANGKGAVHGAFIGPRLSIWID